MNLTVAQFMSEAPHTIGEDQTLDVAHRMMREHDIRHLPVLSGGALVGIVTQRDLHLIETLRDVDPHAVTVGDAMSVEVYAVPRRASVRKVAAEMATHKYGSAVVMDGLQVVGVFTTVDALRALYALLEVERKDPPSAPPARKPKSKSKSKLKTKRRR